MAQRSRKKRKTPVGVTHAASSTAVKPAAPVITSVKPVAPKAAGANPAPAVEQDWIARYSARGEQRNAEARAKLIPLGEHERPWPIRLAVALTTFAGLLNLVLYVAGSKIDGRHPGAGEMISFALVMLLCSVGMWVMWYQAVLAFMVLLAIVLVLFAGFLLEASNVLGLVVAVFVLGSGGFLFWKLVGVLARMQMPKRPARS